MVEIKVNTSVASSSHQHITARINPAELTPITGGNTNGVERADMVRSQVSSIILRYASIVTRDSEQILWLAEKFISQDRQMSQQISTR